MMARATLIVALFLATVAGAADKIELCTLCHGTNVNGNASIRAPKLAGLSSDYIARQLKGFRSGIRGTHPLDISGGEMRTIALSLKENELASLANAVATFKAQTPRATVQGDAAHGKALYQSCAGCHGERGEGNTVTNAPALAQGSDWYLVIQLNNYRNGLRGTDPSDTFGAAMRAAAATLPDEKSVADVAAYINSLR